MIADNINPETIKEYEELIKNAMDDQLLEYKLKYPSSENLPDKEVVKLWAEDMCSRGLMKKIGENEFTCVWEDEETIQ
jgi:hypothetical protein